MAVEELRARIGTLEEAYEFMLAYAAQGLESDVSSKSGGQLRDYLARAIEALDAIPALAAAAIPDGDGVVEPYGDFMAVLERDAAASRAGLRLAASRAAISSQLIDNLNASIHLRALLTDLFLLDELLDA